jgi:hypothetical protein
VSVMSQQEKKGTAVQTTVVVTKISYDDLGRVVTTEERQSSSQVASGAMSTYAVTSQLSYDALGQVKRKELGKRRSSASVYTNTALEGQDYDYNIRGWLLGVNRLYVQNANTANTPATTTTTQTISGEMFTESSMDLQSVTFPSTNFFGFDLGYDKTNNNLIGGKAYAAAQYSGNITGMVWKGANDQKVRKYDYSYDAASRLTGASFGQYSTVAGGKDFTNTVVDYSVSGLSYDENGNIQKLLRKGLLSTGSSAVIDNLSYGYTAGSNKLTSVSDAIKSYTGTKLGDFQDGNKTGLDYTYDVNGNMTVDKNKNISLITYNSLNLPSVIRVTGTGTAGKGTIRYYYDAVGNKLRKVTTDSTTLPARRNICSHRLYRWRCLPK